MPFDWNETTKQSPRLRWNDSLQSRMMLATGLILVVSLSIFVVVVYIQNRKQAIEQGRNRLAIVSDQLLQNFGNSANQLLQRTSSLQKADTWQNWINHPDDSSAKRALLLVEIQKGDSEDWPVSLLADKNFQTVSIIGDSASSWAINWPTVPLRGLLEEADAAIGEWINLDSTLFYPVVIRLTGGNASEVRYLVRWRRQQTSADALNQFASLLGPGINFHIGNANGRWWTDLRQVQTRESLLNQTEMATEHQIPNTAWLLRMSFDEKLLLAQVRRNIGLLLIGCAVVLLFGIFLAGWIGNRLMHPLRQLQAAAESAAGGNYETTVPAKRRDELGRLGRSFEKLLATVREQQDLQEKEVRMRTAQLEETVRELQTSEVKFRGLLESAPDATIIVDQQGRIIIVNLQAEVLFGYAREELIDASVEQLIPMAQRKGHESHRAGYFKDPKVRSMGVGLELYALRRDGSTFPVEISLSPMKTPEGLLVTAAVRDISQRKQIEESIRQVNRELESFTYSVSHDLRAPLRIIDGYADILVEDHAQSLNPEGMRVLQTIKNNARRMGQLIDDLLNLSRMGRREIESSYVDMDRLVRRLAGELNVKASVEFKIQSLDTARCDDSLIEQVWINLISNAIKYSSRQASPMVEIGSESDATEVIYFIRDNGVGFDMKYADKLFGVFQRLHKVTEFEGTGIGLALSQRIVNRHGGRIWAEASPNAGACFWFSLPKRTSKT